MNNALRITLIVFILLVIVIFSGSIYKKQNEKKIAEYSSKIKELDEKINKIDEIMAQSVEQHKELEKIKKKVENFDKTILEYDDPPLTYNYLLKIVNRLKGMFIFDFTYSGQKIANELVNNSYLIRGSAKLNQLYQLISHLEKQKPIYYIYDMAITAPEQTVSDTINFSFMLDSVSEKAVPQKIDTKLQNVKMDGNVNKLFINGLMESKLDSELARKKRNSGLLDISNLKLIAITDGNAFFRDDRGLFQILEVGYKVKNGVLTAINNELGTVEFTLETITGKVEKKIYNVGDGAGK